MQKNMLLWIRRCFHEKNIFLNHLIQECEKPQWIGDGYCDDKNNYAQCDYDAGDCCGPNVNTLFCSSCICHKPKPKKGIFHILATSMYKKIGKKIGKKNWKKIKFFFSIFFPIFFQFFSFIFFFNLSTFNMTLMQPICFDVWARDGI